LKNKIAFLEKKLAEETEHNINLEQYTGRENLRFNNTEETPYEDCKAKVRGIIEEDLGVDISNMRFHAVHRVGKRYQDRCRPIIARFVCREDRDEVWSKKGKIKESSEHKDAYITEDVDFIIRTGGEIRTSGYLMWESPYAEWYFCKKLWPEFGEEDLEAALEGYMSRERRFGR